MSTLQHKIIFHTLTKKTVIVKDTNNNQQTQLSPIRMGLMSVSDLKRYKILAFIKIKKVKP